MNGAGMQAGFKEGEALGPLSFQQDEMIRNMQLHPTAAPRYDGISLFRLEGDIDMGSLTGAIEDVVSRHPALRSVVQLDGGEYLQRIYPVGSSKPVTFALDFDGSVSGLQQRLLDNRYMLADIEAGRPLFRAQVHQRESTLLLALCIHHLIYDAWSLELLWRDLTECYSARLERRAPQLPDLPTTVVEFARRQKPDLGGRLDEAVRFYREALGDCTGRVDWPTPTVTYEGSPTDVGTMSFLVPAGCSPAIRAVSKAARVSPFVVLLSATAVAISRISGQHDLLIGTDTDNRDDPLLQNVMGFFVNTRVVRASVSRHPRFLDLVLSIRNPWLASVKYDDVYYDQVLSVLGNPEIIKVNMLGPSADGFVDQQQPRLQGATVSEVPVDVQASTWRDLFVFWFLDTAGYRAEIFYRLAAVDPATAAAVGEELLDVLASDILGET